MQHRRHLDAAEEEIFEYSATVPVIDTHEHIPGSEEDYVRHEITFSDLFCPYIVFDLVSAGMPSEHRSPIGFPLIECGWDEFEPYWNAVKHGSYARPLHIALAELYGIDELSGDNHAQALERINAENAPGLFTRIFRERCNIETAVRCASDLPSAEGLLAGNINAPSMRASAFANLEKIAQEVDAEPLQSLDDLIEVSGPWMERQVANGAIEFKSKAMPVDVPSRKDAEPVFARLRREKTLSEEAVVPLAAYLRELEAAKAAELSVPLALHTGVWNDFRNLDVTDLIGFIQRNPDTRMDIYHLGIPVVRPALQIVKNYPNAYLNLCWAHIVAADMVVQTMREAVDMVPLNKIFAFGADYVFFIEKIYGHLVVARENLSIVLAERVKRDLMDMSRAREILKSWLYDNPKAFYGL